MSRRDTIIIAVLVNAALLMILFATAIRSDRVKEEAETPLKGNFKKENLAKNSPPTPLRSEELLNEYVTSIPTLAEESTQNASPFVEMEIPFTPTPAEEIAPIVSNFHPVEESKPHTPARSVSPEEKCVNVVVKKGDVLEKIAKANNTTIAAIMKANNMNSTQLKIGQVLKIPLKEERKSGQKIPSSTESIGGEYYIVKEGDNPWVIANRNKIALDTLLKLNGLDEQKAKRLRPGDRLKIR